MTDPFETPEVSRNRPPYKRGRPQVWLPDGSKIVSYTRCTNFIGCMEDQYSLQLWQQRMVALGLADRPDLLVSVAAYRTDREKLNGIVVDAKEAAQGSAAARTGTALHEITDQVDRGLTVQIPPAYAPDIDAYRAATTDLQVVHIEQFCVMDDLEVGGTPDRVVLYRDRHYITDVKTGNIEYGHLKMAMQFGMYAHSQPYDHYGASTGVRSEWPDNLDQHRAILIHLPQGQGRCDLYWVNIAAGWDAIQIARAVRAWRSRKGLIVPFGTDGPPSMRQVALANAGIDTGTVRMLIRTTATANGVRQLYREARDAGIDLDTIKDECTRRVAQLEASNG